MKIVINGDFGGFGFGVAEEFEDFVYEHCDNRTNEELVKFVEENPDKCGDLQVAEIPDNATDWDIDDYDGNEQVIYVLDGKIRYTC